MTISNFRNSEPLYIVIVREPNAEQLLKNWAHSTGAQVTIESNRMKIFEHRSFNLFRVHWKTGYDNVIVWDTWNKRHIELG